MQQLTDEERKEVVARLRAMTNGTTYFSICAEAADEIERLWEIIEYLGREVAGPYGIVVDEIKAAAEQVCSR